MNDGVLFVAGVAYIGRPIGPAQQVLDPVVVVEAHLGPIEQLRVLLRAAGVDGVEVVDRGTEVLEGVGILLLVEF